MDDKLAESINRKLDTMSKLLAFSIINGKSVNEQIDMLTKAGLKAAEIASLLDKTENQVYVTQTTLRKKKKESDKEQNSEQNAKPEETQNV